MMTKSASNMIFFAFGVIILLSDELKTLKDESGLTLNQIAEQSGVPESTVTRIINGSTPDPSLSAAAAVVKTLGGSIDAIVGIAHPAPSYHDMLIRQCQDDIAHERRQYKQILIFACSMVAFLAIFLMLDIAFPSAGWIRY